MIYIREIAEAMGCSRATAWRRARRGEWGKLFRLPNGGRYFVYRESFELALKNMAVEDPTEPPRRKTRRDLRPVPKALSDFVDAKPGTLKRGGRKQTTSNGRSHLR